MKARGGGRAGGGGWGGRRGGGGARGCFSICKFRLLAQQVANLTECFSQIIEKSARRTKELRLYQLKRELNMSSKNDWNTSEF